MIDLMDPVVWPDDPERQRWWASTLGINASKIYCDTADLVEQRCATVVDDGVFDDEAYPPTPHTPAAAAAA
ncbi:hypothetical protein ACFULT_21880 [Rhodococcus sp. NPDC057297]|uniref:hypothetical protein n=1 Tax=Rhodococcus sp. NPDC057297 TaxID=3346090 RepID=UPI0036393FD4